MKHLKLKRIKQGAFYALLFMGFNAVKNFIFDYTNTISLFKEMSQNKSVGIPLFVMTLVSFWIFLSLIIGISLILYDFSKQRVLQK